MSLKKLERRLGKYKKSPDKDYLPGWLRKILVGGIFIGLAIIIAGAAFIIYYINEPKGVDLEVSAPSDVSKGVPFDLTINVNNISGNQVNDASINVSLGNGLLVWNPGSTSSNIFSDGIGNISVGNLYKKVYKVIPVGDLNSSQTMDISISYLNSNGSRFEIRKEETVLISSSVVAVSVSKPDQILNGSLFSFDVNYTNNSSFDFPNMVLEADFPDSFTFDSSSPGQSSLSNTWQLGSLLANSTGTLSIKGEFANSSVSSFDIPLKLYAVINGTNYEVADYTANFPLAPSPIGISISVNGSDHYVAKPVDTLNYSIQYVNKSGIALKDAKVKAVLSGFADWTKVKTDGIFDPLSRTITWDSKTTPDLQFLEPGAIGNLSLSLITSSNIPTSLQGLSTKNLYVKADISITSPSVPYYISSNQTFAETSEETRVSSVVYLSSKALFRDAGSGIANVGSLPPRVGTPTDFTIHWLLSNFGNDLSNVSISAPLPSGITFTGVTKSTIASSSIVYSSSTGSVVWNIGDVGANSGFITGPIEGVFQVEATPTKDEVGSYEDLLGKTTLKASDDFTNSNISISADPVTTLLPYDKTVSSSDGLVAE